MLLLIRTVGASIAPTSLALTRRWWSCPQHHKPTPHLPLSSGARPCDFAGVLDKRLGGQPERAIHADRSRWHFWCGAMADRGMRRRTLVLFCGMGFTKSEADDHSLRIVQRTGPLCSIN